MSDIASENDKVSKIGQDFTLSELLKFALPGLLTSFFSRLFESLDDGLFVSRYVGQTALAGVKILDPLSSFIFAISHLFAVGASTLSAHRMGQGKQEEAHQIFTKTFVLAIITGAICSLFFNVFDDQILHFLGATDDLVEYGRTYIRCFYAFTPFYFITNSFASYYSVAGKPSVQLFNSILDGVLNIVFDIIFIIFLDMGVAGTALANTLSSIIVTIIGLIFYSYRKHEIHFVKPIGSYISTLKESFKIASSQILNSMMFGFTSYATNITLIKFLGSDGVAAQAIIHDLRRILSSSFLGYASTVGPILAYNYASKNSERLARIIKYNMTIWFFGSILFTVLGQVCRKPLISLYLASDTSKEFYDLTYYGLTIEFFSCAFTSGAIMILRMFVAFKNTKVSNFLSITRNFVARLSCLYILPLFLKETGVWWSFPVSEFIAFVVSAIAVYQNRDNYGYGKTGIALLMEKENDSLN